MVRLFSRKKKVYTTALSGVKGDKGDTGDSGPPGIVLNSQWYKFQNPKAVVDKKSVLFCDQLPLTDGNAGYFSSKISPWFIPWDHAVLTELKLVISACSVKGANVESPTTIRLTIVKIEADSAIDLISLDVPITPPTNVGVYSALSAAAPVSGALTGMKLPLTYGMYGIYFQNMETDSAIGSIRGLFGSVKIEEYDSVYHAEE